MIDALIQSAVLFALVAIVTRLLKRRAPASLRHMLWAFAILAALAAPAVARISPLELSIRPPQLATQGGAPIDASNGSQVTSGDASRTTSPEAPPPVGTNPAPSSPTGTDAPPAARRIAWMTIVAGIWAVGALMLLARMIHGLVVVNRIGARATEITDAEWLATIDRLIATSTVRQEVEVRMSDETPVPYTCGLTRPIIVLPLSATEWNTERRDAVLLHELAHISRGDLAMNIISHLTRALYWPNPLAWLAANGLRFEGERAADDEVLRAGARASDYADHLLDIVKSVGRPVPRIALAMARSSDFEGRLLAILEPGVPRKRLGRARTAGIAALFVVVLVPLTGLTAESRALAATPPTSVASPIATLEQPDRGTETAPQAPPPAAPTTLPSPAAQPTRNQTPLPAASEAVAALAGALTDETTEVRLAAVNSLGALQDPAAIAALAKAMKEDTDARVREAAAWALGEIDDNRAVPHLLDALRSEKVAKVRVKIVEALENIDDPSALPGVIAALKDGSAEVRRAAVEAVGEFEDHSAISALAGLVRDEDVQLRRNLAQALGNLEDPAAMEPLKTLASDRDAEVRANAIEALSGYESMSLVSLFVNALKDSSAHVREHAAGALGDIDELRTAPRALIDALKDPNRSVRQHAASALGNIGDEAAVPELKRLTADADVETRRNAVEALKEIGGTEAVTALLGLLKDPDPEVRKMAAEALGRRRP